MCFLRIALRCQLHNSFLTPVAAQLGSAQPFVCVCLWVYVDMCLPPAGPLDRTDTWSTQWSYRANPLLPRQCGMSAFLILLLSDVRKVTRLRRMTCYPIGHHSQHIRVTFIAVSPFNSPAEKLMHALSSVLLRDAANRVLSILIIPLCRS